MSNCSCKRIFNPSGIWTLEDLVGSRVKIHSLPLSNFVAMDCNEIFTIDRIEFRVTMDGKAITIIFLKGFPDIEFTFKDLIIESLIIEDKKEEDEK